jgi:hypothetical protein
VYVVDRPRLMDRLAGEALSEKSALTTSVTKVEWLRLPLVPVSVNV